MEKLEIGNLVAKFPIIQGGMGVGISLSGLAGAVAVSGGIGVISAAQIGYREPDWIRSPLEANLRALTNQIIKAKQIAKSGVIGVNIMVATKKYDQYVRTAAAAGVDLIISGAGLPTSLPKLVEGFQTKIAPIVSSLKSAKVICKLWDRNYQKAPDLVVIEGPRAGGHLGFKVEELEDIEHLDFDKEVVSIIEYVREHAEKYKKKIPVVAAGGIYTREDILHYLALGADGVQMGTRFVTTHECDADIKYKNTYINASQEDIQIVKSPVGLPARAIYNQFVESTSTQKPIITQCHQCLEKCNPAAIPYCISEALIHAVKGDVEDGLLFCGDNAYRATELEYVKDVMDQLTGSH